MHNEDPRKSRCGSAGKADRIWNDDGLYGELSRHAKEHASRLVEQCDAAIECFEQCLISAVKREKADLPNMPAKAETLA